MATHSSILFLENPVDRGARRAMSLGVSRSRTQLSDIVHMHLHKALGPCAGVEPEDPSPCFSLYLD